MTGGASFQGLLEEQLHRVFASFARQVLEVEPRVSWHVEFPVSRIYEFVGLLVFTPDDDDTKELAVASVEFATGRD